MSFRARKEPPLRSTRRRRASPVAANASTWRVKLVKGVFSLVVASSLFTIGFLLLLSIIPLAFLITLPGLAVATIILALALPQLVYVYFADQESNKPLPVTSLRRCLQVDYALWRIAKETVGVGRRIARDLLLRRVQGRHHYRTFANLPYGSKGLALDVYSPLAAEGENLESAPVVVFLAPQIRPFLSRKVIFSSFGANLADVVGAVVVIPDLTNCPTGRIKQQAEDAREVLKWTKDNIHQYGGDVTRLFLSGAGIGATLAALIPLQSAVVTSRTQFLSEDPSRQQDDLPNGVREVKEYGALDSLPQIEGLILIAPITNVADQLSDEELRGMNHLSVTGRTLGPDERTCYFHSPSHLLYAARDIIRLDTLPRRVLFIHGGLDTYIKHTQSETMKEIMRGVGIEDTRLRLYDTGHWGTMLSLMCDLQGPPTIDDVYDLVWSNDLPEIDQ